MKQVVLPLLLATSLSMPLQAQEAESEEGRSMIEEGVQLFFRGLIEEMEPAMDDLRGLADDMEPALRSFVDDLGPALAELFEKVGDLSVYHPPEVLPNGDIILRRKTPLEQEADPDGDIEL